MIDLHCHLLPGLDDGPDTLADSLAMARHAVASGISHCVCTPHIHHGRYDNTMQGIYRSLYAFERHLYENNCPLKVACAAEVRICPEIITMKKAGTLPYLGRWQGQAVLLLELPHSHIPPGTPELIAWLQQEGIQVVIAHPERNRDVWRDYNQALKLVKLGCMLQVTAGAFCGHFKQMPKKIALQLLHDDLISVIASDAHSMERRPPEMADSYQLVREMTNEQTAQRLFHTTPWEIASCLFPEYVTDIRKEVTN